MECGVVHDAAHQSGSSSGGSSGVANGGSSGVKNEELSGRTIAIVNGKYNERIPLTNGSRKSVASEGIEEFDVLIGRGRPESHGPSIGTSSSAQGTGVVVPNVHSAVALTANRMGDARTSKRIRFGTSPHSKRLHANWTFLNFQTYSFSNFCRSCLFHSKKNSDWNDKKKQTRVPRACKAANG